jgi:cation transport ATPase
MLEQYSVQLTGCTIDNKLKVNSSVYIAVDNQLAGIYHISDTIAGTSAAAIKKLKEMHLSVLCLQGIIKLLQNQLRRRSA